MSYELRPTGWCHALRIDDQDVCGVGYHVVERGQPDANPEVAASFVATPEDAKKLLALLNRRPKVVE